jgi:hypothetical protein
VCPGFCKNNVVVLLYEGFQEVQDFREIKDAFPELPEFPSNSKNFIDKAKSRK